MPEPQRDDSMMGDIFGPVTWPKLALVALLMMFTLAVCAICGWAPGWSG